MKLVTTLIIAVLGAFALTAYVAFIGVPDWAVKPAQEFLAESQVEAHLSDPSSAIFRNKDGVCGEVNSKNKFGGYGGYNRYIAGGEHVRFDDDSAEFEDAWQFHCILNDEQRAEIFDRTMRERQKSS